MADPPAANAPTKKRRLQGSCDMCKMKKIRCDSVKMPGNICSNCLSFGAECTHYSAARGKRSIFADRSGSRHSQEDPKDIDYEYLRILSDNSATRAQVTSILSPSGGMPDDPQAVQQLLVDLAQYITVLEKKLSSGYTRPPSQSPELLTPNYTPSSSSRSSRSVSSTPTGSPNVSDTEDDVVLSEHMKVMTLDNWNQTSRFYGRSSNVRLVQTALTVTSTPVDGEITPNQVPSIPDIRRPEFWKIHPWNWFPQTPPPPLIFPPNDLVNHLTALYFANVNAFIPILHRPIFERSLKAGLHYQNYRFGCLVLSVCSVGAKYSQDPAVYSDASHGSDHTVGWQWFSQIRPARTSFVDPPNIHDLQLYAVSILYLSGVSTAETIWFVLALALRYAQDVGAHRKNPNETRPTVQRELWKRAFWALVASDVFVSAFLGRARTLNTEDIDQDYPIDCDDEYWEHADPEQAFKQPAGVPSTVSSWIAHLKLMNILGFAQRTIYKVQKCDLWLDVLPPDFDDRVMRRIDLALSEWIDSVPEHLKWHPHKQNRLFFDQSAVIYASYYYFQILVHRPFITATHIRSEVAAKALAICANAARSCILVMDVQCKKSSTMLSLPNVPMALFNSAVVLLLNLWGDRQLGLSTNPERDMQDVYTVMNILEVYEERTQVAGRFRDLINGLIHAAQFPQTMPQTMQQPSLKRAREEEHSPYNGIGDQEAYVTTPSETTGFSTGSFDDSPEAFMQVNLPFYTNELGSLPVYGSLRPPPSASSSEGWYDISSVPATDEAENFTTEIIPSTPIYASNPASSSLASALGPPPAKRHRRNPTIRDQEYVNLLMAAHTSAAPAPLYTDSIPRSFPQEDKTNAAGWAAEAPSTYSPQYWETYVASVHDIMQSGQGAYHHNGMATYV